MKSVNLPNQPDVVMIYQDRENVEPAIQQIMELELEFKIEDILTGKGANLDSCNEWFEIVAGNKPDEASNQIWKQIGKILKT